MLALFRRSRPFRPLRLGPACDFTGNEVTVRSGPLAGRRFGLHQVVTPLKADFTMFAPVPGPSAVCGHCHYDRDPKTGLETLWNIVIHPDYRRKGLAGLIVRHSLRELLAGSRQTWFAVRKLMKVDTRRPELHNIGIGLLALRLGFRPDPELDAVFTPGNIREMHLLDATPDSPPGLMLHLKRLPGVVVAAGLDPETGKPFTDPDRYRRFLSPQQLWRRAGEGAWLIGNVDYLLDRANIELCCRHLASSGGELRRFGRSLAAGARRLSRRH